MGAHRVAVPSDRGRMTGVPTTAKISVTIDRDALKWLKLRAKRLHRGNLSAVVAEATENLRRAEALDRLLDRLGAPALDDAELAAFRAEWAGASVSRARRR